MRAPFATWMGPVPNRAPGGMRRPVLGLVLHIMQGTMAGTDAWFHNPQSKASAHFGNPKRGPLGQWVDTDDRAWAQASGNLRWVSVENEGRAGDTLTGSQIANLAMLLRWLHDDEGVPLQITDNPSVGGLGWHGMGGHAWGAHTSCPGAPIVAQRARIVELAIGTGPPAPSPTPPVEPDLSEDYMRVPVQLPALKDGTGYWDLDGHKSTGPDDLTRPLVQWTAYRGVYANGGSGYPPPAYHHAIEGYQNGAVTRLRFWGWEPGAAPLVYVNVAG